MAKQVVGGTAPSLAQGPSIPLSKRLNMTLGRDWAVALPFVLPLVVLMVGLILWPFINAILISFTTRSIARTEQWVGLANYARLFRDADYRNAVNNTVLFTVASVSIKL